MCLCVCIHLCVCVYWIDLYWILAMRFFQVNGDYIFCFITTRKNDIIGLSNLTKGTINIPTQKQSLLAVNEHHSRYFVSSVQFSHSVVSDSLWPHDRSMPGLPVHHQLLESTQTHVHWVGDAIQPSHPLLAPSPPAPNPSQHQGLFQWVSCSHQVAKVLEFQVQHQSFQWTPRTDIL